MILGVFGWMKTALGIINVVYDAGSAVWCAAGSRDLDGHTLSDEKKAVSAAFAHTGGHGHSCVDAFFCDPGRILGDCRVFQSGIQCQGVFIRGSVVNMRSPVP